MVSKIGFFAKDTSQRLLHTRQLVTGQTEGVPNNLLVEHTPDLKKDLVDGHSCGPVVEGSLSFTHTHLCFILSLATNFLLNSSVPSL